jgi:hypothetical protein
MREIVHSVHMHMYRCVKVLVFSTEMFAVCGDGSLVHHYYWCDGWPDCPDNHADELYCK